MAENEIKALIRLLDDPDENVYKAVRKKIIAYGANILPDLTKAWQDAKATGRGNALLMSRFEKIVPLLQNNLLVGLINDWKDNSRDLRHIAWLVSRFESFSLDKQKFDDSLDSLRDMIPAYNTGNFTPLEQIRIFNTAFFRQMGFKPVPIADYYNPSNCSPRRWGCRCMVSTCPKISSSHTPTTSGRSIFTSILCQTVQCLRGRRLTVFCRKSI